MKITYNSPVILTFTILSVLIQCLSSYLIPNLNLFFAVPGTFHPENQLQLIGIITHSLSHADWTHLISNFALILLLGPILEEKYGSGKLILMILFTTFITGILNIIIFDEGLLGASGIVFLLILLSSITNRKEGEIPLTFILVGLLYIGQEVFRIFDKDQISQFGHILGGICGAIFGFLINGNSNKDTKTTTKTEKTTTKDDRQTTTVHQKTNVNLGDLDKDFEGKKIEY